MKVDYVGCRINIYTTKIPPTAWEIYNQRTGFPIKHYMEKRGFACTACLFTTRKVIEKVGGFDSGLISGGDQEFGTRVRDAGFKMYYSDHNIMKHPARTTMKSIFKKNVRVARGLVDLKLFYPDRYGKLNLYTILLGFYPPSPFLKSCFSDLESKRKMQMILITCFDIYTLAISRFIRYFQIKIQRIHNFIK